MLRAERAARGRRRPSPSRRPSPLPVAVARRHHVAVAVAVARRPSRTRSARRFDVGIVVRRARSRPFAAVARRRRRCGAVRAHSRTHVEPRHCAARRVRSGSRAPRTTGGTARCTDGGDQPAHGTASTGECSGGRRMSLQAVVRAGTIAVGTTERTSNRIIAWRHVLRAPAAAASPACCSDVEPGSRHRTTPWRWFDVGNGVRTPPRPATRHASRRRGRAAQRRTGGPPAGGPPVRARTRTYLLKPLKRWLNFSTRPAESRMRCLPV